MEKGSQSSFDEKIANARKGNMSYLPPGIAMFYRNGKFQFKVLATWEPLCETADPEAGYEEAKGYLLR